MKHLMKTLVLGGALAALAPFANAASISGSIGFGGNGSLSTAGTFTAGGNTSFGTNAYVNTVPDGTLSIFTQFTPATFFDFNSSSIPAGGEPVFTVTKGGTTLTFTLTGRTSLSQDAPGPGMVGTGILKETGYDDTAASFSINTNANAGTFVTFNTAAAAATPEPSSLILLGTGVLGAAGMLRRRFTGKLNA